VPKPIAVGGGWAFIYVLLAVAFAGAAVWLVAVKGRTMAEPAVIITVLGSLWFVARAFMTWTKKR
jgi:hypothetical protein